MYFPEVSEKERKLLQAAFSSPQLQTIKSWLSKVQVEMDEQLREVGVPDIYKIQGVAMFVETLRKLIDGDLPETVNQEKQEEEDRV